MTIIKRVLLLNPPSGLYRRDDRCQSKVEDQTVQIIFPPIDLAYCAASIRKRGCEVEIGDYPALEAEKRGAKGWELFKNDLQEFKPQAIVFDITTSTIDADIEACRIAKKSDPDIITIAKGEYLSAFGEKIIKEAPELDIAVYGEPERTICEIMEKGTAEDVAGAIYRSADGTVVRNVKRDLIDDLDALPYPVRDLLDNAMYVSPETGNPLTIIHANRGCPFKCIFCPAGHISQYKVRFRSPESIVGELRECVERHGIREFLFHGDTFTMKKSWVIELCDKIRETQLEIRWGCNSRVDTFDDEVAQHLKRAGCWVVAFGVESGSQELLDRMKKKATLDQARAAVKSAKSAGLRTHAFYVIGLPWETKKTLRETFEFARELDTDFFDFNIAYPLPGTELYEIAIRDNLISDKEEHGGAAAESGYARAAVRSYHLSANHLTTWRQRALLKLYLRPAYIWRMLKRAQSGKVRMNYLKAAWSRLMGLLK